MFSMRWGAVLLKHKKTRPGTVSACLAVASKQESCHESRQYARVVRGSQFHDPARPDPLKHGPDPTRPDPRLKPIFMTRPDQTHRLNYAVCLAKIAIIRQSLHYQR